VFLSPATCHIADRRVGFSKAGIINQTETGYSQLNFREDVMSTKPISTRIIAILTISAFVAGCAGSATHKVVTTNKANDESLSCQQIDGEIVSVQLIIDDVNRDKDDVSGVDVIDGILWFPFNLIAKHSNYKDALAAADNRIERLSGLKREKNCEVASAENANDITQKLRELNAIYKEGGLSEDEYKIAKQRILGGQAQ
jgi:hypothetical protein